MKVLIGIVALILGLSGLLAVFGPGITGESSGLNPSLSGITEIRATYGGFHLGFVAFLIWCWFSAERYQYALLAIALMMGGAGIVRVVGLLVDGMPTTINYIAIATEILVASAAIWFLRKQDSVDLT